MQERQGGDGERVAVWQDLGAEVRGLEEEDYRLDAEEARERGARILDCFGGACGGGDLDELGADGCGAALEDVGNDGGGGGEGHGLREGEGARGSAG